MVKKYLLYTVLAVAMLWFPVIAAGSSAFTGHAEDGQIRAFIYHHFGMEDKYPSTSVSLKQFEGHLDYLQKNGYTVLTLGDAISLLSSENRPPRKTAVITIDDGYRSIWQNAVPLLDEYGYKATIFIPTSHVGGGNYLTWDQIAKLRKKGFEIGNHSHSHEYFLDNPKEKVREIFEKDLKESHEQFRKHLKKTPELYAYPFGEYSPEMIQVLKKYGYVAAAAQKSGVICAESSKFLLPRFPMNVHYGKVGDFAKKAQMNALRVVKEDPLNPVISGQNPPGLSLTIRNNEVNPEGLQCFVSGAPNCDLKHKLKDERLMIEARAREELNSRRTLYTITAPNRDATEWYWYSHLWILPERKQ